MDTNEDKSLEERNTQKEKTAEFTSEVEDESSETKKEDEEKKRKTEEEVVEERFYTIPLRKAWIAPRKKRTPRAVRIVKRFIQRHMKIETNPGVEEETEKLIISNEVNEKLWRRGIEKPPRNIRIRAIRDKKGVVTLHLAEGD